MGVTYKLRQDVVDFITNSKKNDPALSCRKLVGVIKESFGLDVSKSSVNEVIKASELSAPIGRPSLRKPPKNFSIPKDTKNLLLRNVQPFLVPGEDPEVVRITEVTETPGVVEEIEVPVVGETTLAAVPVQEEIVLANLREPELSLRPDPVAELIAFPQESEDQIQDKISALKERANVSAKVSDWQGDQGMLYGRLGAAVLWYALESACAAGNHPGDFISRALGALPERVSARESAITFFTAFFAEHRPGFENDDVLTLCRLAGIQETRGREILAKSAFLDSKRSLMIVIHTELAMAFTPARYFRLLTKSGTRYYVDAVSPVLHHDVIDAGQVAAILPVFTAVGRAVDSLITNIIPFVADIPGYGITLPLRHFIQLMDGTGEDEFLCLQVIGDNDVKCAEFTSIPQLRRGFIFKVKLAEEELARVDYGLIDNRKTFLDAIAGCSWRYYEGTLALEGSAQALRVFFVKPEDGEEIVLLSNISGAVATAEELLSRFFQVGVRVEDSNSLLAQAETDNFSPEMAVISEVFRVIDVYARRFLLGPSGSFQSWGDMCHILYDLPGRMKEKPDQLLIRLEPPADFTFNIQLGFFLRKLNAAALKTADGRQITFSLPPLPPA